MSEIEKNNVGMRFRETRIKLNLNQKEFAHIFKISQSVISDIERGNRDPSKYLLFQLAEKYDVDLNWLLLGKKSNTEDEKDLEIKRLKAEIKDKENEIQVLKKKNKELTDELLDRLRDLFRLQKAENSATR